MKTDLGKIQKRAKLAGVLYLIYIIVHIIADIIGRTGIIVFGNATSTAQNIIESSWQFSFGIVIDLIAAGLFLLTAWALYRLLKQVNKDIALLFLILNLSGVIIQCFSDIFLIAAQLILSDVAYLGVFETSQINALGMLFLYIYKNTFMVAQLFYGAWLFPLGYLVFKSGFLPKTLGFLLMIHCIFWLMTFLQFFLFPNFTAITFVSYPLGFIAEFGFALWLIFKGVKQ